MDKKEPASGSSSPSAKFFWQDGMAVLLFFVGDEISILPVRCGVPKAELGG
jgi:hypothetical protein